MLRQIVEITYRRLNEELTARSPVNVLKEVGLEQCIATTIEVLFMHSRKEDRLATKNATFVEAAVAIGRDLLRTYPKNTATEVKCGAFLIYTFEMLGICEVTLGQGNSAHAMYIINILDDDILTSLWNQLDTSKLLRLPRLEKPAPWISTKHELDFKLVKTRNLDVLDCLTPNTCPTVYSAVNKSQSIGWKVNNEVHDLALWSLRNRTGAFKDIWDIQDDTAKASKLRETYAVTGIAAKMAGKVFYHIHTLDFRGRMYTNSPYFSHQGGDLAKGMLLRADSKELGIQGFFWMLVSIASYWGGDSHIPGYKTDKIPLQERVNWALDNEEVLISYAIAPKINTNWHNAEEPWQFIAACIELRKFREWQAAYKLTHNNVEESTLYSYKSSMSGWLDGSNNGIQHLSAMTRDEVVAPYANLTPSEFPGDLYLYVAQHVWETLSKTVNELTDYAEVYDSMIDNIIELRKDIMVSERRSDKRKNASEALYEFRRKYLNAIREAAPFFWYRITDNKQRRKIAKRGVMTISYGSTPYGMGSQVLEDARKHNIELLTYMEKGWGVYMGRLIYEDCRRSIEKPMKLLSLFESAGRRAEANCEFLSWNVPITNFPVVQHYVEGTVKKIWVQYGPPIGAPLSTGKYVNTLQIAVAHNEIPKNSERKQASGASPNIVHSIDAAHLMLIVSSAKFPVTTVHDSFGSLLGDMHELFKLTRETFVQLHEANPLDAILQQIGIDPNLVEKGSLDVRLVLESEYAFS